MNHINRAAPITVSCYRKPKRDRWAAAARYAIAGATVVAIYLAAAL